jgi:hypothetical protein
MKSPFLFIAWIWVAVPLGWGVYQSVNKSLPLFGLGAPASAPAAPVPAVGK